MKHCGATLHGANRCEWQEVGAVANGVYVGTTGASDSVNRDVARLGEFNASLFETETRGVRNSTDRDKNVRTLDDSTIGQTNFDALAGVHGRLGTSFAQHLHPVLFEHPFDEGGCVAVFARQNGFARRN